eukprot:CAMPEP_0185592572 /NCGR_PEP_ID=MMETSP0434-20130131/68360_1 /TAXON_ID=626734 ORGANISM="Favella taraikaensis, Strain Fe Narragansett Bay" /NCGR_SAMPLE_ID=MMETSP0434 /ASSEMBLY_ACC=CAM_ASM_000379 /LENGTH=78 /DNA_ID=CAMNT_0028218473 /DNA_START=117 /DNA_END=353 /DNA_ORIENTATION=+
MAANLAPEEHAFDGQLANGAPRRVALTTLANGAEHASFFGAAIWAQKSYHRVLLLDFFDPGDTFRAIFDQFCHLRMHL